MFHVKPLLLICFLLPFFVEAQHMGSTRLEIKELPIPPSREYEIDEYLGQYSPLLNPSEKDWFYWTNYSRKNPRRFWDSVVAPILKVYPSFRNAYTNSLKEDLYKTAPLPLVKPNNDLAKVAQSLANALAVKKGNPSHTSPNGETFQDRMKSINVKKCAGENISFGISNPVLMLVLLYIDEGVPDVGHRKTLLNPSFVEMGIGISSYPENKYMVVQDFACSQD
jgi:Cysteine-rich secretory protein family